MGRRLGKLGEAESGQTFSGPGAGWAAGLHLGLP